METVDTMAYYRETDMDRIGQGVKGSGEQPAKLALGGSSLLELEELMAHFGEPRYRAKQLYDWIYRQAVQDVQQMTNLPAALRQKLSVYSILPLAFVKTRRSVDGTVKFLLRAQDGSLIETVMIPEEDRTTVCVSSQVGCAMGCIFCATGQGGFIRNLTAREMVGQVLAVRQAEGRRITNVVYMGMGEPLLNYEEVLKSIRILNDQRGLGIGIRHITVSTCGIVPGIRRLAGEGLQLVLAVSLHSADDKQRARLMPVASRYPLGELIEACRYYLEKTGRRVTFEYALIAGVNDTLQAARDLVELLSGLQCHVNLIPVNPVAGAGLERSSLQRIEEFARRLEQAGISVTVRKERGTDIEAACGQLRGKLGGQ